MADHNSRDSAAGFREPPIPALHTDGPSQDIQAIFRADQVPPAKTLMERSSYVPENEPIAFSRYLDADFAELERTRMWSRVWQFAVWSFDIPDAGDTYVYRNAGKSAIVVRQPDGSIRAFENSCPHRGLELCSEDGNRQQIRCPYHAFTWSIEGNCRWIPAKWDFPQIDVGNFPLRDVRCEIWNGFVFVNFDPDAKPLTTYLGKMVDQWAEWDFTKTRYRAVTAQKTCPTNWKAVMDAFIETLHVTGTHPQAMPLSPDTSTQYDVWEDEPHFSRFHSLVGPSSPNMLQTPSGQESLDAFTSMYLPESFGTDDGELRPGESVRQALARLSRMVYKERLGIDASETPEAELIDGTEYMIFPNLIIWPSYSNPLVYRFRPGPDQNSSIWEIALFVPFQGERPPSGPVVVLDEDGSLEDIPGFEYLGALLQQDVENLNFIQNGMRANSGGHMVVSTYQEQRMRHYHNTIDKYIDGRL